MNSDKRIVFLDSSTLGNDFYMGDLEQYGELVCYKYTRPEEVSGRIHDADYVISNKVVLDRETLLNANRLKLILVAATGTNNVDRKTCLELEIPVMNVKDYSKKSVADHTFALLFELLHQTRYYSEFALKSWKDCNVFTHVGPEFFELSGKTWGILGLGSIGREVAKRAESFGCRVIYHSLSGNVNFPDYERLDEEEFFRESHILSIHTSLNDQSRDFFNHSRLSKLRDDAILLNLARGEILCEDALLEVMKEKPIRVGLDVLRGEPPEPTSPLVLLDFGPRLLITPHMAWTAIESRKRLLEGIIQNIKDFENC